MKLSTRSRYGTRAMCDLANHYREGPIAIKDVSKRQELSESYLENLMTPLKAIGLVRTERGSRGGFILNKEPSQITLGEIVRIMDGSLSPVACVDDETFCHRAPQCVTRIIWCRLEKAITDVLDNVTLADMVKMEREIFLSAEKDEVSPSRQLSSCEYII